MNSAYPKSNPLIVRALQTIASFILLTSDIAAQEQQTNNPRNQPEDKVGSNRIELQSSRSPQKAVQFSKIPDSVCLGQPFRANKIKTYSDLRKSSVLSVPVTSKAPSASAVQEIATVLEAYQAVGFGLERKGQDVLEDYLVKRPKGSFSVPISLELATSHWYNGAWSRALALWESAWRTARESRNLNAEEEGLADLALGKYLYHATLMGRKEELQKVLKEIEGLSLGSVSSQAVHRAQETLTLMETRPEQNILCGFSAANLICVPLGKARIFPDVHDDKEAEKFIRDGVSLWDIAEHSLEAGGNLQCVFKESQKVQYASPAVIHWRFGHFSAITGATEEGDRLKLKDAQLKFCNWVPTAQIQAETSGYALIPGDQPVPEGYRSVNKQEAEKVFGRHCVHGYDDEGCDPTTGKCETPPPMAIYGLNLRRATFVVSDTPIRYQDAGGNNHSITLSHANRPPVAVSEVRETFGFSHSSNTWRSDIGGGRLQATGVLDASKGHPTVRWLPGDGTYINYTLGTTTYTKKRDEQPILTYHPSELHYRLSFSDGSVDVFGLADTGITPVYMLTKRRLPQYLEVPNLPPGQTQKHEILYEYDSDKRLSRITDHWGNQTHVSYLRTEPAHDLADQSMDKLIRSITDPFGRIARFYYSVDGRLMKIKDPIGIESSFSYNGSFIKAFTTPYGTTSFDVVGTGVTVTDPLGFKEKIIQTDAVPHHILNANAPEPAPGEMKDLIVRDYTNGSESDAFHGDRTHRAPVSVGGVSFIPKNNNLHWRNSFYWDKKAMYHGGDDWNAATIYNWRANEESVIVPALSSMREPGKSRVWFNYPGQTTADGPVTSYQHSRTVRMIENSTGGTQWVMSRQTYNTLGNPVESTDERGRRLRFNYTPDGQDITTVQHLNPVSGAWVTMRTYTYPNPNKHLPSTVTEASGLRATFTRNAEEQITEVRLTKGTANSLAYRFTYSQSGVGSAPSWPGTPGFLRKIEVTSPANPAQWVTTDEFTYDSATIGGVTRFLNRVKTHTDADGYTKTFAYDVLDRLIQVAHPDGSTEAFNFDRQVGNTVTPSLDLTATKDRSNRWSRTVFNAVRQPTASIDPAGQMTLMEWCLCG